MCELFLGGLFQCTQSLCLPNLLPFSEKTVHTRTLSSFHLPKKKQPLFAFWFVRALWPNGIGDCTASDISYLKKMYDFPNSQFTSPDAPTGEEAGTQGCQAFPDTTGEQRWQRTHATWEGAQPCLCVHPPPPACSPAYTLPSIPPAQGGCVEGNVSVQRGSSRSMPVSLGGHGRPWTMLLKSTDLHGEGHRWAPHDQMHKRFEQLCCSSWLTPTENRQRPPLGFYGRVYKHRRQGHEWWPAQHSKDTMPRFWGDAYTGTRSSWSTWHLAFIKSTSPLRRQDRHDAFHSITIRSKEEERLSCNGNCARACRIREMRARWGVGGETQIRHLQGGQTLSRNARGQFLRGWMLASYKASVSYFSQQSYRKTFA